MQVYSYQRKLHQIQMNIWILKMKRKCEEKFYSLQVFSLQNIGSNKVTNL